MHTTHAEDALAFHCNPRVLSAWPMRKSDVVKLHTCPMTRVRLDEYHHRPWARGLSTISSVRAKSLSALQIVSSQEMHHLLWKLLWKFPLRPVHCYPCACCDGCGNCSDQSHFLTADQRLPSSAAHPCCTVSSSLDRQSHASKPDYTH
jgi:hypothetical protein